MTIGRVIITPYHTIDCAISLCVLCLICHCTSQVLSPDCLSDEYHILLSHDPPLLCFIILSLTIGHMSLCLLIIGPLIFPWPTLPLFLLIHLFSQPTSFPDQPPNCCVPTFIFAKAVNIMEPLYQPTPTEIIWSFPHSLMPLFLYCCVIYGLHVCGVLSQPHFCIYTALGRCGWAP